MPNPLYKEFGNQNNNDMTRFMRDLTDFKNNFRGDPRQTVEMMLRSGQLTQEQFNQYAQETNEIMKFFK